jgi:glycosyltransferase involved in cell wall biosynthesis
MMLATLVRAREEGWRAEAMLPVEAAERTWIGSFEAAGIPVHYSENVGPDKKAELILDLLDEAPGPTLLHTHFSTFDVAAVKAKRRRPGVKVFWHTHTILPNHRLGRLRTTAKNLLYGRGVDRILCPARNIAEGMADRLAPKDRIAVFPNPIDASNFPLLDPAERASRREILQLPEDATVLLLFGRDWHVKGGDTYMEAVRLIADRSRRECVALVHRGGEAAAAAARDLGVSSLLRDVETREDVQDLLGASDVLMAPSRSEGMPFTVIESLCTGTPVVASKLPGHDFLPDGYGACEVVERRAQDFADATLKLLSRGREESAEDCRRARRWIVENLSLETATATLMREYDQAMARPTR